MYVLGVRDIKIFGVYIDEFFMWSKYIEEIIKKIIVGISVLKWFRGFVSWDVFVFVYIVLIMF